MIQAVEFSFRYGLEHKDADQALDHRIGVETRLGSYAFGIVFEPQGAAFEDEQSLCTSAVEESVELRVERRRRARINTQCVSRTATNLGETASGRPYCRGESLIGQAREIGR